MTPRPPLQTEKSAILRLSKNPRASTSVSINVYFDSLKLKHNSFQLHSCWQVLQMECRWVLLSLAFSHSSSFLRTTTLWGRWMQMAHSIPTKHIVLRPVSRQLSKCGYILKVCAKSSVEDVRQWTPFWSRVVHIFIGVSLFVWLHRRGLAVYLQRLASAEVCVCDMKY